MTERARKLLQDAMELPLAERAELATELLASLDGEPDSEVETAWATELERRAREALADPDEMTTTAEITMANRSHWSCTHSLS